MTTSDNLADGARNLLLNCAGLKAGDRVLIVHEDPALGWYDKEAPMALGTEAEAMGMTVGFVEVGGPEDEDSSRKADRAAVDYDCVIYMARIGDLDRFALGADNKIRVMCYARDAAALASAYGRTHHEAMLALKEAVNDVILCADRVEVSCPLGTAFSCDITDRVRESGDVAVRRFPMGVPQAVLAEAFTGRVALARYLTPTGNRSYEPASLTVDKTVFAAVEKGRITGYEGDAQTVSDVQKPLQDGVGYLRYRPGFRSFLACRYSCGGGVSTSPRPTIPTGGPTTSSRTRVSCISTPAVPMRRAKSAGWCWTPTVSVDGTNLWQDGRLCLDAFAPLRREAEKWPVLSEILANPSDAIGLPD